jgi:[glutamine synthetase] adenylyltransferase / [glutamine synthetase]-adenylyl-L-tyrosine phosphorylase
VPNTDRKKAIEALCPEIDREVIQDFFARMDEDYFTTFSPEEISKHIALSCRLDPEHRIRVRITGDSNVPGEFNIVIVGFDYLAEFSVFCGLLSAFGLDIREGDIYSFARKAVRASRPLPRKIVDVFTVALRPGETFDETKQREFQLELQIQAQLLAEGAIDQVRERLNRFLIERIERMNEPLSGLLSPIEITFNNEVSSEWTVVEAQSDDSFAFLYAISNALSMRGVYIHKVKIRSAAGQAVDQFFVVDRWGHKIQKAGEQERMRMAVAMIKQFTGFLPEAPDPAKAMRHFDQFLDKIGEEELPDHIVTYFSSKDGMNVLAHLLGSSDFLWDEFLSTHFAELVPALEQFGRTQERAFRPELRSLLEQASSFEEKKKVLNSFKDRQVFLIDVRHLLDSEISLTDFSQSLTELAEAVIDEAARICAEHLGGAPHPFAIFGLGKFGGREMGYASDLELLFVHEGEGSTPFFESLARQMLGFIEARSKGIFHIDMRLRPYGEKGALSTLFTQFVKYYSVEGAAAPFERQALIKLRWVAGDENLGRRVEAQRDAFTYSDAPWDWEDALHLRKRQIKELVKRGQTNVKYSPGGIVDIEYAVQYLQILNGKEHPEVRDPNTLVALDRLRRVQIIREPDYAVLNQAYLFLRNLIDALRIVRGDASDLVLPEEESEEFKSLARRLGYRDQDRRRSAARLATDIRAAMKNVNEYFQTRFTAG